MHLHLLKHRVFYFVESYCSEFRTKRRTRINISYVCVHYTYTRTNSRIVYLIQSTVAIFFRFITALVNSTFVWSWTDLCICSRSTVFNHPALASRAVTARGGFHSSGFLNPTKLPAQSLREFYHLTVLLIYLNNHIRLTEGINYTIVGVTLTPL